MWRKSGTKRNDRLGQSIFRNTVADFEQGEEASQRLASSMRIEFLPSVATVGHLSRWIVVNAPDVVKAQPGQWSREQVSEIVREIVIDILGCDKEYREDAHFVKDLGMG